MIAGKNSNVPNTHPPASASPNGARNLETNQVLVDLGGAKRLAKRSRTGRAALPSEASAAEVAKEGQHNNDDDDDPENRHVILSLGAADSTVSRLVFATCATYAASGTSFSSSLRVRRDWRLAQSATDFHANYRAGAEYERPEERA
jgi:hypothetical protein